jgi:uncharacterized protein (TIGR02001 family)
MRILPIAALAGAALFATTALADDAPAASGPKLAIVYNVGAQTDYMFRGLSQTTEAASGFAGADATYGEYYAGVWTSNVNLSGDTSTTPDEEIDVYGGWRPTVAGVALDLGVQYYGYANTPRHVRPEYTEVYVKASRAFGPFTPGVAFFYCPKFWDLNTSAPGKVNSETYSELNGAYVINPKWTVSAAVGYVAVDLDTPMISNGDGGSVLATPKFKDYTTWNIGATYAVTDKVTLDLRYIDTDNDAHKYFGDKYAAGRVVAQLKSTF